MSLQVQQSQSMYIPSIPGAAKKGDQEELPFFCQEGSTLGYAKTNDFCAYATMCLENWRACEVDMHPENTHIIALLTIEANFIPQAAQGPAHQAGGLPRRRWPAAQAAEGPARQASAAYHEGGGCNAGN